jgi:hypothetical protein
MFVRVKKDKKSSSRVTTSHKRLSGKHSSSEPSTPSPRLPALTSQASTEAIIQDLRNLSFHSLESVVAQESSGRAASKPIPIPPRAQYRRLTLSSTPAPAHPYNEMKLGDAPGIRSPFAWNTTEAASSEGDDESTLAVHNSPSRKHSPSPDSIQFDCEEGDAGIAEGILTSDDEIEIETIHGSTKRRASRSIFSSSPSPEPVVVRSPAMSIPVPSFKRSRSQE